MIFRKISLFFVVFSLVSSFLSADKKQNLLVDTLPKLKTSKAPQSWNDAWNGFDPRAEPIDIEVLKEWEEDNVVLKVLRYRIGIFKGQKAMMAGVYGYPKEGKNLPGLLQIHGGGQYADYKAPLSNAKRGYASISISWAGRISAPGYRVSPLEVKLFWEGKTNDPRYKLTTDWGALDAYHAPSRNGKDAFPSIPVADWTLDSVPSPRNNSWFLATLGARRGLTFLELQPEIDPDKLGVYGHSMGGKLSVLTAGSDKRVKAVVPSCGGISDRYNTNPLHLATVSDPPSLRNIRCPILFQSPSNDFHGRINDLKTSINEIKSKDWRVACSPHHNHQDSAEYEVASQLWFDQYLKGSFKIPSTPQINVNLSKGKKPMVTLNIDESKVDSIDVFYTQQGQMDGKKDDSTNTKSRFWHHVPVLKSNDAWATELSIHSVGKPLWVYANVTYKLGKSITGAGYYYGMYKAEKFTLSSLMQTITPRALKEAKVVATMKPNLVIEDFKDDWKKEWFSYNKSKWGIRTHKIYDPVWAAPQKANLYFEVKAEMPNKMIVGLDSYVTEISLTGNNSWQGVKLRVSDFKNIEMKSKNAWSAFRQLRLNDVEQQRPPKGSRIAPRTLGAPWKGRAPEFRYLRWLIPS